MFDDRATKVPDDQSLVERALRAWLDRSSIVFELADDIEWHGRRADVTPDAAIPADTPVPTAPTPRGPAPGATPSTPAPSATTSGEDTPSGSDQQEEPDDHPPGCRGIDVPDGFGWLLESGAEHLAAARAALAQQARLAAVQARELAAFARDRPADLLDRPDHEVGAAAAESRAARPACLTDVSEWAVDEVMAALALSSRAAGRLLAESVVLVERLPATLAALEEGVISWAHAQVMIDRVASLDDDETRHAVEAALLAKAAGRTAPQLREAARRAVLRADASAAADRMVQAIRDRSVRVYDEDDGMASLTASMPAPVAQACYRTLEAYADACHEPGDDRTKDQRMADCLADLILGTGASDDPRVQVTLTVVAGVGTLTGGDDPGEIDGHIVPAAMVREVAYALGLLPRPQEAEAALEGPCPTTSASSTSPADGSLDEGPYDAGQPATRSPGGEMGDAHPPDAGPAGPGPVGTDAGQTATRSPGGEVGDAHAPDAGPVGPGSAGTGSAGTGSAGTDVGGTAPPDDAAQDLDPPVPETSDIHPSDAAGPAPGGPSTRAAGPGGPPAFEQQTADLAGLLGARSVDGTALAHRPTVALVDEMSGALLALTDGWTIRRVAACDRRPCRSGQRPCDHPLRGEGLGPPGATDGYVPSAALDGFVRARDRRCRFPGCRTRATRGDLDHTVPWPAGPTSADNLHSLCRHHHRLRHQAQGWTLRGRAGGGLEWRLPGGDPQVTFPVPYGTDDVAPLAGGTDPGRGAPAPSTDVENEPPGPTGPPGQSDPPDPPHPVGSHGSPPGSHGSPPGSHDSHGAGRPSPPADDDPPPF